MLGGKKTRKVKRTGQKNQCQCLSTCQNKSLPGKAFCTEHMKGCSRVSPLSGWEPTYEPDKWNKKIEIRETHNCFSYSMNVNDPKQMAKCRGKKKCDTPFHQPGAAAGYERFSEKHKTCPNMVMRILGDNPTITMSRFEDKCPRGSSKIALVVDESDDYHFLRQDRGGYWSQKSGARRVTNLDADGHEIWDPQLCNLDFRKEGTLNYEHFCGYMCVPRKQALYLKVGGSLKASKRPSARAYASSRPFRTTTTRRRS